ncbi:MAG: hypothetical protein PUF95_00605, partial [Selenomonadaceae bacterium]|nr:hypothetical protein [Selenomonadaceae bacterium]
MRAMDNARKMAESYRKSADAAGVDVSQFGAGVTLEDAAQNLNNDYYRGIQNLLGNNISSDEYYQNVFDIVKKNGGTDTQARQIAAEKAGIYQAKRIANLTDAFQNYGLNEGGSYNDVGARIIMSLLQENPTTANALATQYGTPKDDYKNAQVLNAMAEKAREQANIANLNAQLRAGLLDRDHVNRMQEAAQAGQIQAYLRSIGGSGGGGSSSSGSSEGNVKLTAAQQKEDNQFNTYLTQLLRYTSQPAEAGRTTATDAENGALEGLNRVLDEMRKSGNFDPDTIDVYQERAYNLANSLQAKYHQPQDNYS